MKLRVKKVAVNNRVLHFTVTNVLLILVTNMICYRVLRFSNMFFCVKR